MQIIPFCLFALILGYSVVISAPVQKIAPDSEDIKHQKAHAIANRLLKELAGEQQVVAHSQEESPKKEESQVPNASETKPAVEKVESHVENEQNDIVGDDEEIDDTPSLEDLMAIYGNKYAQLTDDDESLETDEETDDDFYLPPSTQELLRYLDQQEENDESDVPVIHTPVIDDSIMTAEDHHQRRRRSIY